MKSKFLNRCVALVAFAGCLSSAQAITVDDLVTSGWTKVESITDVQNYYYMFVDAKSSNYAMAHVPENGRGCYKTLDDPLKNMGFLWILESNGDAYNLKNVRSNCYFNSGSAGWNNYMEVANDNANYTFTLSDGKYSIKSVKAGGLLGPWNNDGAVAKDGENVAANKTSEQAPGFYLYSIPRAPYVTSYTNTIANALAAATKANPVDATYLIFNSDFSGNVGAGWAYTGTSGNKQWGQSTMEAWNNNAMTASQTLVNLPNGLYKVSVDLISGPGVPLNAYLYAVGGEEVKTNPLTAVASEGKYDIMSKEVAGNTLTTDYVNVIDGTLTIGISDPSTGNGWFVADNFKLSYYGQDVTALENSLKSKIAEAEAIDQSTLNNAVKTALAKEITEANAVLSNGGTVSDLETAASEISSAVTLAKSTVAIYAKINTLLATCNSYVGHSTPSDDASLTTFSGTISIAETEKEIAATLDALNAAYDKLENARQAYVMESYPTGDVTFDMTFKVVNPTFEDGTSNGWTYTTNATNHGIAQKNETAITGKFFENWDGASYTGTMEQTIQGLPNGTYKVVAAAFRDQVIDGAADKDAVYVFAGSKETLVSSATSAMYTVEDVQVSDGKLTLGLKSKVKHYKWMGIDNVSLTYIGVTLAFCEEALQQAIENAETVQNKLNKALKDSFAKQIATAKAAKVAEDRTIISLEKATADLIAATDSANEIALAYAKVNAFLAICNGYAQNSIPVDDASSTSFNGAITIAATEINIATTIEGLNAAYDKLETARQAYVLKAYPTGDVTFDMTFKIVNPTFNKDTNGWTVSTGKWHTNSGYDGISGIAEIANWGANSWEASISQNISLPNGKYKVKVAAQASAANTELKLTANGVSTSLTCIGDKGGNIAKDGSVVEMGNGVAGWQYIEFECLVINGTLAIAANSSATAQHCWANVDNFTLTLLRDLTDEERYEKKEANINISAGNKLATCVLPFDAELPVGVNAYTAGTLANNTLKLVAATTLKAFTPYILYAENGYTGTLTGDMDKTAYKAVVNGTLAGAVETQTITTGYALQNQGEGVKFYAVDTEKSQKVTIPAGKCWLDVVKGSTPAATTRSINLSFPGDETTGMKAMEIPVLIENGEIYTIDGKRVETMQSGKIYIIGGQKVIKK